MAIARALLLEPDILLADEPVASLDPINAEVVMDALQDVCRQRGIPVIVNLHSLDIARRYCTRVIGMSKGKVVYDGAPAGLTPEVVDKIYGSRNGRQGFATPVVAAA